MKIEEQLGLYETFIMRTPYVMGVPTRIPIDAFVDTDIKRRFQLTLEVNNRAEYRKLYHEQVWRKYDHIPLF